MRRRGAGVGCDVLPWMRMMFFRYRCQGNISPIHTMLRDMDVDWIVIGGHQTRNLSSIA